MATNGTTPENPTEGQALTPQQPTEPAPVRLDYVQRAQARQDAAEAQGGYPIPGLYKLAENAHKGTSFDPEKRAHSYVGSYQRELADDVAKIQLLGEKAGAEPERIQEAADAYAAGYISKLNAWLSAKGRCISWMITGRSNFPVRRAQKANDSEHNRMGEFIEYRDRVLPRTIKRLSTPPTMQEQADKYAQEAAQLEKMQELMKAGNRIVKAAKGADCTEKLLAAGLSEKLAREAQKEVYGRVGFPAWMLTNNLANIKRVRQRAAEVAAKAEAQQQVAAGVQAQHQPRPFELNGQAGVAVVNIEADRVQLIFDGKPDADTISQLKRQAFKWSPRFGAWQRQDTANGRYAVQQLTGVNLDAAPVAAVEPAPELIEQPAQVEVAEPVAAVEPTTAGVLWTENPAEQTGWSSTSSLNKYHYYHEGKSSCNYQYERVTRGCFITQEVAESQGYKLCSSCLNNLAKEKKAQQPAPIEQPAPAVEPEHHHPTKSWEQLSPWQRKQYGARPEATPAPAPASVQLDIFSQPAPAPVAAVEPEPNTCTALEAAAVAQAVELEIDLNRLVLLAGYHGPAHRQQEHRLPDWHPLSTAQLVVATEAEQRAARNGSPVTPENQAKVSAAAVAGKLNEKQRRHYKWLGFDVPEHVSTYKPTPWTPRPAPAPEPADVVQLEAGAAGPATSAQVYELAPFNALRLAYDTTPRTEARNYATIYAEGRRWRVSGNVWERWAGMTDRQAANSGRRARLEAERTEKANEATLAAAAKAGPLAAIFYGAPELKAPRYTTAEEAKAHEMKRRQAGHDSARSDRARAILKIRAKLASYTPAEVARLYTDWQRRTGGHGLEYLLDMFTQHDRAQAKVAAAATATEPDPIGPATPTQAEAERSAPAAPGWHVIARPEHVAPEHLAQLAQLRAVVQALPIPGPGPTLYEVVQLSQQLLPGCPFHVEARPDGLAIGYGAAEVLRLAPAGQWPAPSTNRVQTRSAPPGSGYVPPKVAPIRPASRAQVQLLPAGGLRIYLPEVET